MLYKGCVSCSGLISSVGETDMILLGFREESLALKLEKLQSPSISQCNIYFFVSILLASPLWSNTCPSPAHKATPVWTHHCCQLGVSQVMPSAWWICIAPTILSTPGPSPLVQTWELTGAVQPNSHPRTSEGQYLICGQLPMGTKSVTFQSSKKSTCVKKKEKGDFLVLSTACELQHKPLQQPMEE